MSTTLKPCKVFKITRLKWTHCFVPIRSILALLIFVNCTTFNLIAVGRTKASLFSLSYPLSYIQWITMSCLFSSTLSLYPHTITLFRPLSPITCIPLAASWADLSQSWVIFPVVSCFYFNNKTQLLYMATWSYKIDSLPISPNSSLLFTRLSSRFLLYLSAHLLGCIACI